MEGVARRIAGLDLSVKRIGYADPDGGLHSITARAGASDPARRLHELRRGVERLLQIYPPFPDVVVIENYSLGSPGRLSLIRLGEIGGVIRTRLFELGIPYVEIRPSSLKLFATTAGGRDIDKAVMVAAAKNLGARPRNDDEADAFHARQVGIRYYAGEATWADHERQALEKVEGLWPC